MPFGAAGQIEAVAPNVWRFAVAVNVPPMTPRTVWFGRSFVCIGSAEAATVPLASSASSVFGFAVREAAMLLTLPAFSANSTFCAA